VYSGISRQTITSGVKELREGRGDDLAGTARSRRAGGGRKNVKEHYPEIMRAVSGLIEGRTKGNSENSLLWTGKSMRGIKAALDAQGIPVSHSRTGEILKEAGYGLQTSRGELVRNSRHPDRNAQFEYIGHYINRDAERAVRGKMAVLSVVVKKKENTGKWNGGGENARKGKEAFVYDHDVLEKTLGEATPYGIYDLFRNAGFINVGLCDTSEFAVNSIKAWWMMAGMKEYAAAEEIVVTADCGGGKGRQVRPWKYRLQLLANETGKKITVLYLPPGTSKWNRTGYRLFSFAGENRRGKPLISAAVIVSLIGSAKPETGLKLTCIFDNTKYKTSCRVSDSEYNSMNIQEHKFHGEWNYTISPH
jgi:transposase